MERERDVLEDFFEHSPCGYLVLAMDGRIQRVNAAFVKLAGASEETLLQRCFQELLTRASVVFYRTHFAPVLLSHNFLKEIALEIALPNHQRLPVLVNAQLRRDADDVPTHMYLALFDATERMAYERELLESRKLANQMEEVLRRSADAIVTLTPEGKIQSWNRGAEHIFGYTEREALGASIFTILQTNRKLSANEQLISLIPQQEDECKEIIGRRNNGEKVGLSLSLTPHIEPPGMIVAFSAILRDTSASKLAARTQLQKEMLASVELLAESITEQISSPLEALDGLLSELEMVTNSSLQERIQTAREELTKALEITCETLSRHRKAYSNKSS